MRSFSRTIAEIVRERFQATRQRRLDVHPRVHRSWTFAGLRAFSNCLLRDLNTAVVSEEMMRGARSIYVDYVDYDEIGHHAGATRIESLAALGGLDQVRRRSWRRWRSGPRGTTTWSCSATTVSRRESRSRRATASSSATCAGR